MIRKHSLSLLSVLLVAVLFVFLAAISCNKSEVTLHDVAKKKSLKATTCTKNFDTYTYANGSLDPDNEYLQATTLSCRTDAPWVLLIHGGSWINGTPANMNKPASEFYDAGWQVFNMEYRRGDNISWNLQKNDIEAAYTWVTGHAALFNLNVHKGTAVGFSAGGHMAAWLGNLKPISSVLSMSGIVQPQRVADDDNGLRPDTEPTSSYMHNLHVREMAMMGCDYGDTTSGCGAAWDGFDPETAIDSSSAPAYLVQGNDDPVNPPPAADAYAYWLGQQGIGHQSVRVNGYAHTMDYLFDGTSASNSRWSAVRNWIVDQW